MSFNNLHDTGATPANTLDQLLHIGGGNLAAGAVVRLGDGTATTLTISSAGITVAGTLTVTAITASGAITAAGVLTGASAVISGNLSVGGSVTSPLSLAGVLVFSGIQTLSGAGAIDPTKPTTLFTSTGASQALTLADGTHGQIKTIVHVVDGGSGILTPTTKTGYTSITMADAGDSVTLQFFTTVGWCVIASHSVSIS